MFRFRERNENSSLLVYVLHKTRNLAFPRRKREKTAKKCTKKAKVVVLLIAYLLFFFLDVLLAVASSNLLKRNCRHHLILQRVFVVTTETSYQMLEVLFILRSRVGLTSFNKSNPVNFSGEKIKRSFPLCFFFS